MRMPRVRLTVRSMLALVAAIALGLALWEEFREGLPPRFVVRGIPGRIARLRPGMTWERTREILGLERSWLAGGTGARWGGGDGYGHLMHEVYYIRPPRTVVEMGWVQGRGRVPMKSLSSTAAIHLQFHYDVRRALPDWRRDKGTYLVGAFFSRDSTRLAEMPGSR